MPAPTSDAQSTETPKRTRRTKAEMEAARAAEASSPEKTQPASTPLFQDEQPSSPKQSGGLIEDDAPATSQTGQTAPSTTALIADEEWEKPAAEISDAELTAICAKHAQRTNGKASELVKNWKLKHGIPRIVELKPEYRAQLVKELEAL